ncbi:MAG TPA: NUDIX hydrolase [Kribbella sp.]
MPPGGAVERGETPRAAAARELVEETGVSGELLAVPAAVAVRSYRADWAATLGLSYGAVVGRDVPLVGESGQPPRWVNLDGGWESAFSEDREPYPRVRTPIGGGAIACLAAGASLRIARWLRLSCLFSSGRWTRGVPCNGLVRQDCFSGGVELFLYFGHDLPCCSNLFGGWAWGE